MHARCIKDPGNQLFTSHRTRPVMNSHVRAVGWYFGKRITNGFPTLDGPACHHLGTVETQLVAITIAERVHFIGRCCNNDHCNIFAPSKEFNSAQDHRAPAHILRKLVDAAKSATASRCWNDHGYAECVHLLLHCAGAGNCGRCSAMSVMAVPKLRVRGKTRSSHVPSWSRTANSNCSNCRRYSGRSAAGSNSTASQAL